jgi:DNA-binding MarR family transcriptional regulator
MTPTDLAAIRARHERGDLEYAGDPYEQEHLDRGTLLAHVDELERRLAAATRVVEAARALQYTYSAAGRELRAALVAYDAETAGSGRE